MNLGHWPPGGGFGNVSCRVQNVESKDNGRLAADKQASGVLAGGGGAASGGLGMSRAGFEMMNLETLAAWRRISRPPGLWPPPADWECLERGSRW